jgi:hypothetical protein
MDPSNAGHERQGTRVSLLSDFEDRVGQTVEGGFARIFRSPVQPAEIAKAAGKEADRRRKVGPGKVWAPTLYNVLLSPEDDKNLGGFADTLAGELETYLVGYSREKSYALAARPVVRFIVDPKLKLGRFDVIGELLSPAELEAELGPEFFGQDEEYFDPDAQKPATAPAPAEEFDVSDLADLVDMPEVDERPLPAAIPAPAPVVVPTPAPASQPRQFSQPIVRPGLLFDAEAADSDAFGERAPGIATVTVRGIDHDVVLRGDRMVVGRLTSCDVCLQDKNTSRQHAAFVREGAGWSVEDLGSTNGMLVNGHAATHARLHDGDVVVVGITELVYHEARG